MNKKKYPPISKIVRSKDHHFIVMDKPPGVPVQPDQTGDKSLLQLAEIYAKRKLKIATRLDRPVSGLTVFAKTTEDIRYFNSIREGGTLVKTYVAIVEGNVENDKQTLTHFLFHNKLTKKAEVKEEVAEDYKEAKLYYTLVAKTDNYTILQVDIETGRFHQIRAQLSHIGHPIKGDVKYGAKRANADRSIYLSCHEIMFKPKSGGKEVHCFSVFPTDDELWKFTKEALNGKG